MFTLYVRRYEGSEKLHRCLDASVIFGRLSTKTSNAGSVILLVELKIC